MVYFSLQLLLTLGLLHFGACHPTYQQSIPNGEIVPSPCNPNHVWKGVGHTSKGGGGPRNQFGIDFQKNGHTWTPELCNKDSDGDGRTNGEELGDPDCTWQKGDTPKTSIGHSHPGFCEPVGSAACEGKNSFLDCATSDFVCDALSDRDILNTTVRLTRTTVPAQVTTYMCQVLDVPTDRDYHLVAHTPYIDNVNVMHHILVYGCNANANITAKLRQPNVCFMEEVEGCETIIAIWAVGSNGVCYHEDAGFKVGKTGYRNVLIEMHWNNPLEVNTYTDSSGITLHLTPNLRPYEAGMIPIGQTRLVIPPGREKFSISSTCSSVCTRKKMNGNIYVTGAFNHMHYLGSSALTQMVSYDNEIHVIASDPEYSYDSPQFHTFNEPFTVKPGYELQLHCDFKSTSRSKTTFYGEGTYDEMCYAFLMYYPKINWPDGKCLSYGPGDSCEWNEENVRGCDLQQYVNTSDPENIARYMALQENCRIGICLEECMDVVREIFKHPCYQSPMHEIMQGYALGRADETTRPFVLEFFNRMNSCAAELAKEKCKDNGNWPYPEPEVGGAQGVHFTSSLVFIVAAALLSYFQ